VPYSINKTIIDISYLLDKIAIVSAAEMGADRALEFLTVSGAARRHHFSAAWLRNEIREGRLPAYQRGKRWKLVYEPELIAHLRSMRVRPANTEQAEQAHRRVLEIMKGAR